MRDREQVVDNWQIKLMLLRVVSFQFLNLFSYPEIVGFVLNKVISFFKFPDYVAGAVYFANAGFKNEIVINASDDFSLQNRIESDVFIAEISNDG
jgi:hypothetical protein